MPCDYNTNTLNYTKMEAITTRYLVRLNGKGIKMGKKKFYSEEEQDAFEKQMKSKFARNETDLVVVMFY